MININKFIEVFDTSKDYQLSKNGMVINSILDLGNYYVTSVIPKNMKYDETFDGGLFKIDKKFTTVTPFNLENDRDKYLTALKKGPIYKRTKKIPK